MLHLQPFQLSENQEKNVPIHATKLNSWVRLTFSVQSILFSTDNTRSNKRKGHSDLDFEFTYCPKE